MSFFKTPLLLKKLYPGLIWDNKNGQIIQTHEPHIFLTFDDGPVDDVTPFVLETLDAFNAKATFFCVGDNITKNPGLYRKIIANGHATGNHTFNHIDGWKTGKKAYLQNIAKCREVMALETYGNITGKYLFRPPYGKITRSQIRLLTNTYKIVMWDILAGDFNKDFNKEKCLKKIIKYTTNGTIVIFHDSHKAWKNLNYVLPRYLDYLSENGYQSYAL